ncbi:YigZ family protein [Lacticaseibacillus baoqingensis]|uniref:YigZ family protein n=1 Tax=Lacticaseibacillus baoqingensis TaxID=2486013 RepID=A0ABW4E4D5_9LACO|nr:YigZ family protein [Lacticaseibacillus baoqingensis]
MTYHTIAADGEHELIIKKSRFITRIARIHTEADAQNIIQAVRKTHYKANHNVPAYLLGDDDHIQRANDDGEPSGTAGVPMLQTLQQMGLHDVLAITTRYFGGTKLGAGGLIRAYSNSVQEAVHSVGIVARQWQKAVTIQITYAQLGAVQNYLQAQHQPVQHIDYAVDVTLHLNVNETQVAPLQAALTDLLSGQLTFKLGERLFVEVPVPI